jgi:hypothetical protein
LRNVKFLVKEFRRSLGKEAPVAPEVNSLEKELARVEVMLKVARTQSPSSGGQSFPSPVSGKGRGSAPGGEEGARRSWRPSLAGLPSGRRRAPQLGLAIWEFLKRLAAFFGVRRFIAAFRAALRRKRR